MKHKCQCFHLRFMTLHHRWPYKMYLNTVILFICMIWCNCLVMKLICDLDYSPTGKPFWARTSSVSKNVSWSSQCLSQAAHRKLEIKWPHPQPKNIHITFWHNEYHLIFTMVTVMKKYQVIFAFVSLENWKLTVIISTFFPHIHSVSQ